MDQLLLLPSKNQSKKRRTPEGEARRLRVPQTCAPQAIEVEVVAFATKNQMFLRCVDVPWAMSWLLSEHVGEFIPEPEEPEEPEDVDLRAHWSPCGSWTVKVMRGALKGAEFQSLMTEIDEQKWAKGTSLLGTKGDLQSASWPKRKSVLLAYLEDFARQRISAAEAATPKSSAE